MESLLFLAHRIPYPPNKGDKIRSFNILRHLAERYAVSLGAFVDDPDDFRYAPDLRRWCEDVCLIPLHPQAAKLKSLSGFFCNQPLTLPYYRDARLSAWVESRLRDACPRRIFVFSSAMAQYVEAVHGIPRCIDFVDVDSDKWRQYAGRKAWPLSWVYQREGRRLLSYEAAVAQAFEQAIFVSEQEATLFKSLAPQAAPRVDYVNNGVDIGYFDATAQFSSPFPESERALVFTGAMDYWPNVDAVRWFADHVFGSLHKSDPALRFYIVGIRPAPEVSALAVRPGIVVTGAVDDVRPYIANAHSVVAPLRIARGIQNKVLEALALAKPVIASSAAMEGIEGGEHAHILVANTPEEWIAALSSELDDHGDTSRHFPANAQFIRMRYSWDQSLRRLDALLADYAGSE